MDGICKHRSHPGMYRSAGIAYVEVPGENKVLIGFGGIRVRRQRQFKHEQLSLLALSEP